MPRKNPTSVVLAENVQKIKDDLAPIYGLKNILSAGLILFGKLTSDQQKNAIVEAKKIISKSAPSKKSDQTSLHDAVSMIKDMLEVEKQQPGTVYRVLNHEEQAVIDEFREAFGLQFKAKKVKKA